MRPGGRKKDHLLQGLGFASGDQLLLRCERKTAGRHAACRLFWTLGGNQVGTGAIAGWQEVLKKKLDKIGLWPFDGTLEQLLRSCPVVVAETYPGDVYGQMAFHVTPYGVSANNLAVYLSPVLFWNSRIEGVTVQWEAYGRKFEMDFQKAVLVRISSMPRLACLEC